MRRLHPSLHFPAHEGEIQRVRFVEPTHDHPNQIPRGRLGRDSAASAATSASTKRSCSVSMSSSERTPAASDASLAPPTSSSRQARAANAVRRRREHARRSEYWLKRHARRPKRCNSPSDVLGLAFLASLTVAGGVQQAPEPFCPQPAPPPTSRIERFMADRRALGLRSDRAYVRMLVRRGVWEYDVGYIPVTPRENRYLRLRDRLRLGPRVGRYLRRHPGLSGGVSVQDDWPREPYLLVRVTRHADRHERVLRRLAPFPDNLRTKRVDRSLRSLRRVQDRIDFRAHEADGFYLVGTGVDIGRNQVVIDVITTRGDAAAYFRARYGAGMAANVIATELTSPTCTDLFGYRPALDGTSIVVGYEAGGDAQFDHVELVEQPDRVEVAVVVQLSNGGISADSRRAEVVIPLAAPLGTRRVIDTTTGKRLPVETPFPPDPGGRGAAAGASADAAIALREKR